MKVEDKIHGAKWAILGNVENYVSFHGVTVAEALYMIDKVHSIDKYKIVSTTMYISYADGREDLILPTPELATMKSILLATAFSF